MREARHVAAPIAASALLVAAVVPHLGRRPLWLDESYSAVIATSSWTDFAHVLYRREINMAAYYLMLRLPASLAHSELVLRLPSLLAAVATVWYLHRLVRRELGSLPAAVAVLLFALSSTVLSYAQEARSYTTAMLVSTASTYHLLRGISADRARRQWLCWAAWSVAAPFVHIYCVFVLLGQGVALAVGAARGGRRPPALAAVAVAASIGLLAAVLVRSDPVPLAWIHRPDAGEILKLAGATTGSGWSPIGAIVLTLALAGAAVAFGQAVRVPARTVAGLAPAGWLVLPFGLSLLISLTALPILHARYAGILVPATAAAVAVLVAAARPILSRALHTTLVLLLLLLLLPGAIRTARTERPTQDFSAVLHTVLDQHQPGDGLVAVPGHYRIPVDWYLRQASAGRYRDLVAVSPPVPAGSYSGPHVLDPDPLQWQPPSSPRRIWVVAPTSALNPRFAATPLGRWLTQRYPTVESTRFPGLVLRLYSQ
jgi:mannosyltransferase